MIADPILLIVGILLIALIGGTIGLILGVICIVASLGHYAHGRRV